MSIRSVTKVRNFVPVKNAFMSVFNKNQATMLVEQLFSICPGLTIFSSGGTYTHLKKELGDVESQKRLKEVSAYTGMPETDGGLVKTLHHKLFLGYLTETFSVAHQEDLKRENAVPIDLAIVDLYPFSKVVSAPDSTFETARGNIDVGGPSALRAAAKNFLRVMTVPEYTPLAYDNLVGSINVQKGHTSFHQRFWACQETFRVLSEYDTIVSGYVNKTSVYSIEKLYEFAK